MTLIEKFAGIYRAIDFVRKAAIVVLFSFIVVSMGLEITGRICRLINEDFEPVWGSLEWTDEILRYINIWVIFLGAGLAVKHSGHLQVRFVADRIGGPGTQRILRLARLSVIIAGLLVVAIMGAIKTFRLAGVQTQMAPMSIAWFYLAIPVGCTLMAFEYLLILLYGRHPFAGKKNDGEESAC